MVLIVDNSLVELPLIYLLVFMFVVLVNCVCNLSCKVCFGWLLKKKLTSDLDGIFFSSLCNDKFSNIFDISNSALSVVFYIFHLFLVGCFMFLGVCVGTVCAYLVSFSGLPLLGFRIMLAYFFYACTVLMSDIYHL